MASMREFRGEDHCYQKEQRHISHLLKGLCRLMGQKLNYLEDLIPVLSGVKLTKYLKKTPTVKLVGASDVLEVLCCFMTWTICHN